MAKKKATKKKATKKATKKKAAKKKAAKKPGAKKVTKTRRRAPLRREADASSMVQPPPPTGTIDNNN